MVRRAVASRRLIWILSIPAALVVLGSRKKKPKRRAPSAVFGKYLFPPPRDTGAPFAGGPLRPVWPIDLESTNPRKLEVPYKDTAGKWHGNMSRAFKASRAGRWHVGMDLYANVGDEVLAPEDGQVVATQFFTAGTHGLMFKTDSGAHILFGEIERGSWDDYGAAAGQRIKRGQPLARVGIQDSDPDTPGIQGGAHMLHLEMYTCCPTQNIRWYKNKSRDPLILDPTDYLLRAKASVTGVA